MSLLIFDTETTGLPSPDCKDWSTCRLVQIAWIVVDSSGTITDEKSYIINEPSYASSEEAVSVHHITEEIRSTQGVDPVPILKQFVTICSAVSRIIFHSGIFDIGVIKNECEIYNISLLPILSIPIYNTKQSELYRAMYPTNLVECVSKNDPSYVVPHNLAPHDALYDTYLCYHLYQLSSAPQTRKVVNTLKYINDVISGKKQTKLT